MNEAGSNDLSGRVAIVTGAARNIGRAIAVELGRQGANVVVNAQSSAAEAAETAAMVVQTGGRALVHLADVSTPDGAQSLADAAVAHFGGIDILVNNAAIRRETPFDELDWQQWRAVLGVILDGAYLCAHAATPWLRKSQAGAIVNIGGMSAHGGSAGRAHVMAAKMGLVGLTRALAHDLGDSGVTVNCVVPGLDRHRARQFCPGHASAPCQPDDSAGAPWHSARGRRPGGFPVRTQVTIPHGPDHARQRRCLPGVLEEQP